MPPFFSSGLLRRSDSLCFSSSMVLGKCRSLSLYSHTLQYVLACPLRNRLIWSAWSNPTGNKPISRCSCVRWGNLWMTFRGCSGRLPWFGQGSSGFLQRTWHSSYGYWCGSLHSDILLQSASLFSWGSPDKRSTGNSNMTCHSPAGHRTACIKGKNQTWSR